MHAPSPPCLGSPTLAQTHMESTRLLKTVSAYDATVGHEEAMCACGAEISKHKTMLMTVPRCIRAHLAPQGGTEGTDLSPAGSPRQASVDVQRNIWLQLLAGCLSNMSATRIHVGNEPALDPEG